MQLAGIPREQYGLSPRSASTIVRHVDSSPVIVARMFNNGRASVSRSSPSATVSASMSKRELSLSLIARIMLHYSPDASCLHVNPGKGMPLTPNGRPKGSDGNLLPHARAWNGSSGWRPISAAFVTARAVSSSPRTRRKAHDRAGSQSIRVIRAGIDLHPCHATRSCVPHAHRCVVHVSLHRACHALPFARLNVLEFAYS